MEEEDYPVYEEGGLVKTAKYLMVIFNSVFFGFGSIMFSLCLWIRFDPNMDDYVRNINFEHYWDGVIVVMVGAIVLMLGCFIGCIGTLTWSKPLIITYGVVSLMAFTLNLGGSIYLLSIGLEATQAYPYIQKHFRNLIYRYNIDMDAKRTVDIIQEYIGCCGAYTARDWKEIHMPVPNSCRDQVTGNQYRDSCAEVVSWYLQFRTGWVSGTALCICFLQIFTGMFAMCTYKGVKDRQAAYKEAYG